MGSWNLYNRFPWESSVIQARSAMRRSPALSNCAALPAGEIVIVRRVSDVSSRTDFRPAFQVFWYQYQYWARLKTIRTDMGMISSPIGFRWTIPTDVKAIAPFILVVEHGLTSSGAFRGL